MAEINFEEIFGGETIVGLSLKGFVVKFQFREIDAKTDLEYQRRQTKTSTANGKIRASDEALTADLWLFDQLCIGAFVEVEGEKKAVPDFKTRIPPDFRRMALFNFRQRLNLNEDFEGN